MSRAVKFTFTASASPLRHADRLAWLSILPIRSRLNHCRHRERMRGRATICIGLGADVQRDEATTRYSIAWSKGGYFVAMPTTTKQRPNRTRACAGRDTLKRLRLRSTKLQSTGRISSSRYVRHVQPSLSCMKSREPQNMSRPSIATPCPAALASSQLPIAVPSRRISTASLASTQDDTTELDYTRAVTFELTNAKPRRKSTFQKRDKRPAAVTIFEDVLEDEELVVPERKEIGGSTLLGRPAQRIHGRVSTSTADARMAQPSVSAAPQPARRTSPIFGGAGARDEMDQTCNLRIHVKEDNNPQGRRSGLQQEPRRRTIFVPTDDTTILTIHPGAQTTDRLNDTFQFPDSTSQQALNGPESKNRPSPHQQLAKRPRMSLAVAPKRLPLQQTSTRDNNAIGRDAIGKNGGKENLPPCFDLCEYGLKPQTNILKGKAARHSLAASKLFEPTASSQARQTVVARNAVPLPYGPRASSNAHSVHPRSTEQAQIPGAIKSSRMSLKASPPSQRPHPETKRMSVVPSSRAVDQTSAALRSALETRRSELKTARLQQYPVLSEDLAHPQLYEDSWLSHQEIALTELVNQIFSTAEPQTKEWDRRSSPVREQLIAVYHTSQVANLHKRLQASLLYGALSRPKDLSNPPNPASDLGLRKRFLAFWLDSYDLDILGHAAEVVFGRQLRKHSTTADGIAPGGTLDPHRSRRALIGFLESFLIEVDDAEEPGDDPNARWRKMILRSLMLVWLLDQAKSKGIVQQCLFKASAPRKSSGAMLVALAGLLIPSVGDIGRALRHLDFEVQHVQDPLDEVRYRVDNIAGDLRDGILLARLVEMLLFTPDRMRAAEDRGDATITIQLPDLTILESALDRGSRIECPRILSQHLKMPCLGRAQKLYNVQIAISAFQQSHGKAGEGDAECTAVDIVDGHREKTLSLLWSLVSNYGLGALVDFTELAADIRRTGCTTLDERTLPTDDGRLSYAQQESLLKKWASAHAARHGIRIGNLTTAFADGNAYSAILDDFASHIETSPRESSTSTSLSSETQLRAFGCSNAFIKQLGSTNSAIPSRKATISNLAFLASRLLPLSRRHNAAVTIQRAFRLHRSRTVATRRVTLMKLAHACAIVVQTQNHLVSAAIVLQRAWRGVVEGRNKRLDADVELFQSAAKSWLLRRMLMADLSGSRSGLYASRSAAPW